MVKFIHVSDTHEDTASKLLAIGKFAKGKSIDAILHTGDLISAEDVANKIKKNINNGPKLNQEVISRLENNKATKEDHIKYRQYAQILQQNIFEPIIGEYQKINSVVDYIKKENKGLEVVVKEGNHDLKIIKEAMPSAKMADEKGIKIKGINIKGVTNTWEFPSEYGSLQELLGPYFIDYALGTDAGKDKKLTKIHEDYLKQLKQGEKADLIMMHKELQDVFQGENGVGTAAKTYLAENKYIPVLCGHYHGEFKNRPIENYKDHPFVRAMPDIFHVLDINEKTKKINKIDIYKLVAKKKQEKYAA